MEKTRVPRRYFIGTAGWSVPRDHREAFASLTDGRSLSENGSALSRYARVLDGCEINSTFWRRHRTTTFERWYATVPATFRFAIKVPRTVTHEGELARAKPLLQALFSDLAPLREKLGPLLIQLPPSLAFEPRRAGSFFRTLRALHQGPVACEPRHASWYLPRAEVVLRDHDIARVAADPPRPKDSGACEPLASSSLVYYRLHGSPRPYYSEYGEARVGAIVDQLAAAPPRTEVWCIYDNTASGAAAGDALRTRRRLIEVG